MTREQKFMAEAVALSASAIHTKQGGPFGCVIVKNNEVVGRGSNRVFADKDPTAHAEIVAIRDACKTLDAHQLDGCELYTSCEPCPMCLGAIYWARPMIVYYANTHTDAARIGFDDSMIYEEINISNSNKKIPLVHLHDANALQAFTDWQQHPDTLLY